MGPDAIIATVVPTVFLIASFAILFLVLHFRNRSAQFRHEERRLALEKGIELPPEPVVSLGRNAYLLRGLVWLFVGLGISLFFLAMYWAEKGVDRDLVATSTLGLIPIGVGAAYLIVYRIQAREERVQP